VSSEGNSLLEKATILVVDDAPDGLMLVNGILKDQYRVKVANRGEKALSIALSDTPPDLILLDVMMPEMNGYEVCERLKADPRGQGIPVIFLTAKTDLEDEEKGLKLGAVDYIAKPISPPILLARVETHLKLKASQDYLKDMAGYLEKALAAKTASLEEARAKLAKLVDIGIALASGQDSDDLVERIRESAKEISNAEDCVLFRRNTYNQLILSETGIGGLGHNLAPINLVNDKGEPNNDNMLAYAVNTQTTVNLEDASAFLEGGAMPCVVPAGKDHHWAKSMLVVPLKTRAGEAVGALQLINAHDAKGLVVPFLPELERFVEALAAQAATALHNRELLADARYRLERLHMQQEMEGAARMQQALLPPSHAIDAISQRQDLVIQSHFQPSSTTGGDLWGCHEIDEQRVAFYAFDFTGHGLGAALNTFRLHALINEHQELWNDPDKMLTRLDTGLCRLLPPGQFATVFYGVLDRDVNELRWSGGGAPLPVLISKDGKRTRLNTKGVPLGLRKGIAREKQTIAMLPGDSVLFYSDGLNEASRKAGGMFGDDGVDAVLDGHQGAEPLLDVLMRKFKAAVSEPLDDDLTAVLISRN